MSYWVIETARQTYWDGKQVEGLANFIPNIHDAVRFADFESAETVRCWLLEKQYGAQRLRSTEHMNVPLPATT